MWGVSTESYERRYKNRGHANKANTQKVSSAQSGAHLYSKNSIPQTKQNMQEEATENQQIAKDINVPGADNNVGSKLPESVGAAKANPKNITHLVNEYGEIKLGENPARFVTVLVSTDGKDRVAKAIRTIMEAGATKEKMQSRFEKLVADGVFSHDVMHNKETADRAISYIENMVLQKRMIIGEIKSTINC